VSSAVSVGLQDEASKQQMEVQANAHLALMPLALPAPPVAGGDGFAGGAPAFGGGPGYGAPMQYGGQPAGFAPAQF
jgi:hypothetical protein